MRKGEAQPVELLWGKHKGQRGALIGAGPSLDLVDDLKSELGHYDVLVGINEAILMVPELDYLTCFDFKAARKTWQHWPKGLKVILADTNFNLAPGHDGSFGQQAYICPSLSESRAGSLGMALSFCRELGITKLDLWGVDLCWHTNDSLNNKYAKEILRKLDGQVYKGHSIQPVDRKADLHFDAAFERFVREIRLHKEEWACMDIRNKSPISQLDAFPMDLN